ncbi:MAG: TIGR02281 family clan AA aspartic protease [Asticcacaulis sp.]|nr:TIGR02281 family clan AA aspartic protease [Asticcacaulis sp.]
MLKSAFVMGSAIVTAIVASTAMLLIDNRMRSDDNQPPAAPIVMAAQDQPSGADGRITAIPKSGDGHFWATALVNEKAVRFLVDTGATEVVLTPSDAQRLGFDASNLTYDQKVVTANGQTRSEISNVDALVVKDGLSTSLLGMSYLGRLSRIEATPSSLVLHP